MKRLNLLLAFLTAVLASSPLARALQIEPLHRDGQAFKNDAGEVVRLWGVNVAAFYPDHQTATAFAANLASRGINVVRWHHMLRSSEDWNWTSGIRALVTYEGNSRTPDPEAWDRFDFLNAELERHGIYTMLGVHWTRDYLPGDVDILTTTPQDKSAWMAAQAELNGMPWYESIDKRKMLVTFDDRCARIDEEFLAYLLEHANPYRNGMKYKDDPQVVTLEILNEFASEYTIFQGNRFDDPSYPGLSYWDGLLQARFASYCAGAGVAAFSVYAPQTAQQHRVRSDFLLQLDRDYFHRIEAFIASHAPTNGMGITFSNLWRGERSAELHYDVADHTEDHIYGDPFVVGGKGDFVYSLSSYLAQKDRPYIVGEINMDEGQFVSMRPHRTMMYLAAAAYGSLQDWAGVTWFAWNHGDRYVGSDGWGLHEAQEPANDYLIGDLLQDAMVGDHLRTAGAIFKGGLVAQSVAPKVLWVEDSYLPDFGWPVPTIESFKPGWQSKSEVRKAYGPIPAGQASAPFTTQNPPSPLSSDTSQITKDIARSQLTFSASRAEGMSGALDAAAPANLRILEFGDTSGFATVIIVDEQGSPLETSERMVLSRTYLDGGVETDGPQLRVKNLAPATAGKTWHAKYTRPRATYAGTGFVALATEPNGDLLLPNAGWRECELALMLPTQTGDRAAITRVSSGPSVDGLIDGVWSSTPSYPLDHTLIGSVTSQGDLSAQWRGLWDQARLYLLVEVTDDAPAFGSAQPYDDDSIEVFVDANNSKGASYDGVDDFHYLFRWTEGLVHFGNNSVADATGVAFSIENIGASGYVYEVSIPWSTLGVSPVPGLVIGAEVEVNDDDDGGARDAKRAWHATVDQCWQQPSLFGEGLLVDPACQAEVQFRTAGTNVASLSAAPPVLGGTMAINVALAATTGHPAAYVFITGSPAMDPVELGQYILIGPPLLVPPFTGLGPVAQLSATVPSHPAFCGLPVHLQALHFGGTLPPAFSNAIDAVLGQ